MAMDAFPFLISKKHAAMKLSISHRKLEGLIAAEELPVKRIGRRVLVSVRALEDFAAPPSSSRDRQI
jgi:excisionase family DNA binding protein